MADSLRARWRRRGQALWQRWLTQRIPRARQQTLNQKTIFIVPTAAGWVFLLSLLVMLLTGINYENNLVLLATFLMGSVFVVAILHTFRYLSGLQLQSGAAQPVFAGQSAAFEILLTADAGRFYPALSLAFQGEEAQGVAVFGQQERLHLHCRMPLRGWQHAPRLRIENRFPLGLLRAWSWLDLDCRVLVYPKPLSAPEPLPAAGDDREGQHSPEPGIDDFEHLRDYQPGDSLRHVAWKTLAKEQPLQTREYRSHRDARCWLDWQQFAGHDTESRLSLLCHQVLSMDRQRQVYGLRLPERAIQPAQGPEQRERLLRALALHGQPDPEVPA